MPRYVNLEDTDMTPKEFAARLALLHARRGGSWDSFYADIGVDRATGWRYRSGQTMPSFPFTCRLVEVAKAIEGGMEILFGKTPIPSLLTVAAVKAAPVPAPARPSPADYLPHGVRVGTLWTPPPQASGGQPR